MGIDYNQMEGGYDKYQVGQQPVNSEVAPIPTRPNVSIGQAKYAKRAGATSIYKDITRNTADDNEASAKAEGSTVYEVEGENEESQGI